MANRYNISHDSIKIDGREYVTFDAFSFGDYSGYGSIGLSNIRYVANQCEGHVLEMGADTLRHISEGCPYSLGESEAAEEASERPWAILTYGSYDSQQIWVRKAIAFRLSSHGFRGDTWAERLENYPSLDDEGSLEIEMEWEMEAWECWLRSDLLSTLPDDDGTDELESTREAAEALPESDLFECYRAAMDETNTYPEAELSNVYVDVGRIALAFLGAVLRHRGKALGGLQSPASRDI